MSNKPVISIEDIAPGEKHSRLNSVVFFLLLAIPAIATILFGAVDTITWVILSVAMAAVVILWLTESWKAGGLIITTHSLQIPLTALVAIAAVQLLPVGGGSPQGSLSVPAANTLSLDPYSTRFFLRNVLVLLAFFAAVLTFLDSESRLRKAVIFIVTFGGIMGFAGILQKISGAESIYGLRFPFQANPFGPFINSHHFAGFMEMTAGVALGLLFGNSSRDRKLFFAIGLVVMLAAIAMTSSRGGMLATFGAAALAAVLSIKYKQEESGSKLPLILGAGAMVILVVGLVLYLGGDESLTRGLGIAGGGAGDVSSGRLHFWSVGLRIFLDHPLIGAGFEAFGVAFTRYDIWNGQFRVEQAHNDYIQMLADGGVLGFACVAGFVVLFFRSGMRTIRETKPGFRRDTAIGAVAGCSGIMIHSFFDFPLRTWSNSFVFLLIAAMAVAAIPGSVATVKRRRKAKSTT